MYTVYSDNNAADDDKRLQTNFDQKRSLEPSAQCIRFRSEASPNSTERWQVTGAVCLERLPIITPSLTEKQANFKDFLQTTEVENSLLSDYEIRQMNEEENLKKAAKERAETAGVRRTAAVETMKDVEAKWEKELKSFKIADRITEADRNKDMKSLERKLDQTLILIVKMNERWTFPEHNLVDGLSMRETAEEGLQSVCGKDLKTHFFGNAPCGFQQVKYTSEMQSKVNKDGKKTFFYKAEYKGGEVQINKDGASDYLWVTADELRKYVGRKFHRSIKHFLLNI